VTIKYSFYLRTFYEKLKTKKGSGKAIIATAKKLHEKNFNEDVVVDQKLNNLALES
jgi:hypothetical protein